MMVERPEGDTETGEAVARVVAFYLPQYHQIPENDRWWSEGFTDWTNVRRARALFVGHDQPRVPTDLGYYDLSDLDVHYAQSALAKRYGVAAFCYYAYWFGGRRLLERPLELVGANPDLNMPYAICWANEPWTRRWDGSENEVLMEQRHAPERDHGFIDAIGAHLADRRYLRIHGKPLLLIYRAGLLVDPRRTTDRMRERAASLGLGDLHLSMVQSFAHAGQIEDGFDSAVEFPPHGITPAQIERTIRKAPSRVGSNLPTAQFDEAIRMALSQPAPEFTWFRTVMPGWDNTPRRGARGIVYVGSSPTLFREWLAEVLHWTCLFRPPGERLVFVNAWNEWAEGAYLEPDSLHGVANLEAVRAALTAVAPFACQTAALFEAGSTDAGLLAYAQRPWRPSSTAKPPLVPFGLASEGHAELRDAETDWAVKATLWTLAKVRQVPPVHAALRATARLLRDIRRRWVER